MNKFAIVGAAALLGMSGASFAAENVNTAPAAGSVNIGADLGFGFNQKIPGQKDTLENNAFKVKSQSTKHFVFGGHVGYDYAVMPALKLGAELGYIQFGQSTVKADDTLDVSNSYDYHVTTRAITLLATAKYNVYNGLGVFAKAGPAYVIQSAHFDYFDTPGVKDGDLSKRSTLHKVAPFVSVGTSYDYNNFIVSVAYDHLFGANPSDTEVKDTGGFKIKMKNKVYSQNAIMASIGYALPV